MAKTIAPGEHGDFSVSPVCRDEEGKWKTCGLAQGRKHKHEAYRSQGSYRDHSGVRRTLSRRADTAGRAETKLALALKDLLDPNKAEGDIKSTTLFVVAGREWIESIERPGSCYAPRSVEVYALAFRRYIDTPEPELKRLLSVKNGHIRDLSLVDANNTQRLMRFLQAVADTYGSGAAHHARQVVVNIIKRAIRFSALTHNAVRDVGHIATQTPTPPRPGREPRDTSRAFTQEDVASLLAFADSRATEPTANPRTQRKWQTAAEILAFMAVTACRVSEVRELRWEQVHLDLCACPEAGAHAIIHGKGSKDRRADFGENFTARLRRRMELTGGTGYVFSAPALADTEKVWDQSGCAKALSALIVGAGFTWATPHTLRRTALTILANQGVPDIQLANLAGHSNANTTKRYYYATDYMGARPHLAAALDL